MNCRTSVRARYGVAKSRSSFYFLSRSIFWCMNNGNPLHIARTRRNPGPKRTSGFFLGGRRGGGRAGISDDIAAFPGGARFRPRNGRPLPDAAMHLSRHDLAA